MEIYRKCSLEVIFISTACFSHDSIQLRVNADSVFLFVLFFDQLFRTKHNVVSPLKCIQIKSLARLFCVLSLLILVLTKIL